MLNLTNLMMEKVHRIARRRIRVCKQAPICPKCRTAQVQLFDGRLLARWKCRHCKYKWIQEPLVKE